MAHDHSPAHHAHEGSLSQILDLDAEVLHAYRSELFGWLAGLTSPRRIADLGAGTGTGTSALAEHFGEAEITAVDLDPAMLEHLRHRLPDSRIHTLQADLDAGWPALADLDLVWAANSMHHLADPDRVLSDIHGALRPDGVLAVAEMNSFPRFLTGTADAALEERCQVEIRKMRAHDMPEMGSDWGARLTKAGFTVEAERVFPIELTAPLPAATGRYAKLSLGRVRGGLEGRLTGADLTALDALVDGLEHRDDLSVRDERTVWIARR